MNFERQIVGLMYCSLDLEKWQCHQKAPVPKIECLNTPHCYPNQSASIGNMIFLKVGYQYG